MGKLRDKIFGIQKERNIQRLSSQADSWVSQLDTPVLTGKLEAAQKLNEISEKLIQMSNMQLKKDTRALDERTANLLNQMQNQPNLYQQMRQEEMRQQGRSR